MIIVDLPDKRDGRCCRRYRRRLTRCGWREVDEVLVVPMAHLWLRFAMWPVPVSSLLLLLVSARRCPPLYNARCPPGACCTGGGAWGQLGSRKRNVLLSRTSMTPAGFETPGGSDYQGICGDGPTHTAGHLPSLSLAWHRMTSRTKWRATSSLFTSPFTSLSKLISRKQFHEDNKTFICWINSMLWGVFILKHSQQPS